MVVPVGAVRQLRGEAAAHAVVLGAGGLAQGIGDAGQVARLNHATAKVD